MRRRTVLLSLLFLSLVSLPISPPAHGHFATQVVAALAADVDFTVTPDPPGGGVPPPPAGCLPGASGANAGLALIHPDWDYCATLLLGMGTGTYEGAVVQANYACEVSGTVFANPIPTPVQTFDGTYVCALAGPPVGPGLAPGAAPPAPAGAFDGIAVGSFVTFTGTFPSVATATPHVLTCVGTNIPTGGGPTTVTTATWAGECTVI